MNRAQPWAEAVAIAGGRIAQVGSRGRDRGPARAQTEVIDALGRLVLPGFVDCHVHFMGGSLDLAHVDLDGADTVAEIQNRVKAYAAAHPREPWILGRGWAYTIFGSAALPHKKLLDDIVSDRPVFLTAYDGHTTWANSKALGHGRRHWRRRIRPTASS